MSRFTSRSTARNLFLAVALLIAVIAAAPLFANTGTLNTRGGGDSPFLLQRLHQLAKALGDGHFPVRWMPDANYGYGYPFYNYYAPLSIYIAAVFRFLGGSYVLAIKAAQLAGFVVAAWGMFALGRRWLGSNWAGLLAAIAYTLAPFHMVNIYVRGDSLAEFWAMAFYPLVVLGVDRIADASQDDDQKRRTGRRIGLALLSLVYAALILSHNISALIFTPFLLLYLALDVWDTKESASLDAEDETNNTRPLGQSRLDTLRARYLLWVALALLLALAISAWFWIPALAESSLAQLEPVREGYFHFSNHFRDSELVQRSFAFDYDPEGGRAFSMGLVQAAGILVGAAGLLLYGGQRPNGVRRGRRLFIISGLLLATFMVTSLSLWLWNNLPLLSFTQFPWRFLSIQAFFGALATGGLALFPARRLVVPLAIGLLLLAALTGLQLDFLQISDGDVTAERLAEYEWYSGNIGTTVSAEYLPETVQPRPQTSQWLNSGRRHSAQVLQGEAPTIEPLEMRAAQQEWRIVAGEEGATITLPTMAWPGWLAQVDGKEQAVEPAPGSGLIVVQIPPGEHLLELRLARTTVRLLSETIALVALAAWVGLLISGIKAPHPDRRVAAVVAGAALLLILLWVWPEPASRQDDLNWDFAQMAYLHHAGTNISFDNGARLSGYHYNVNELTAGQSLLVTLAWAEGATGLAQLELLTPAANRSPRAPAFARDTQVVRSGPVTFELAIPENAPAGLVVPRLIVDGAQPLTPSGLTRGNLFLRPLLLKDKPHAAQDEQPPLEAHAVIATMRDDRFLDLQLQWLTQEVLSQNYNYSLRLVDGNGQLVVQQDGQPGFGFLPSSSWSAGQWTDDWSGMALGEDARAAAAAGPLDLVVLLYDASSGEVVLTRLLGQLAWQAGQFRFSPIEPSFDLPAGLTLLAATFGPTESGMVVGLEGYELSHADDRLDLTLYWSADTTGPEDLHHFVHLEDAVGAVVAQHDGMPQHDSYPTSQWATGEVVADDLQIDLKQLADGEYMLQVGLYYLQDGEARRVPVTADGGRPAPDDRLLLPETILIRR